MCIVHSIFMYVYCDFEFEFDTFFDWCVNNNLSNKYLYVKDDSLLHINVQEN